MKPTAKELERRDYHLFHALRQYADAPVDGETWFRIQKNNFLFKKSYVEREIS